MTAGTTPIVDRIAEFVASTGPDQVPAKAVPIVVDAVTDAVGVGLAGSREPLAGPLREVIGTAGGAVPLLGGGTAGEGDAAVFNGAVLHALDYDDTTHPAYAHPSSHLVPVLVSLGRDLPGARVVAAYVVGLEIESRLGHALNMWHYLRGWHTTGTFGTLAATACAANLLGLDRRATTTAIALASSMAAGVRSNFGTMTKPLHAGLAARNGVLAARLAQRGFTAAPAAFEGTYGFLEVYGDGARDERCWTTLGEEWEVLRPYGLALKPYPSCGATHCAIEAALTVRARLGGETVRRVRVGVNEHAQQILIYHDPVAPLEGKFCMEYCVAAALVTGAVNLDTFSPAALALPEVRALLPQVEVETDDEVRGNTEFGSLVEVETESGLRIRELVPLAKGKPDRWLATADLRAKFLDCATRVLDPAAARQAFDAVRGLAGEQRFGPVLPAG